MAAADSGFGMAFERDKLKRNSPGIGYAHCPVPRPQDFDMKLVADFQQTFRPVFAFEVGQ